MDYFGRREMPEITREEFEQGRRRVFGRNNPDPMKVPFWEKMIRWGGGPFSVAEQFGFSSYLAKEPVWCFHRLGMTTTVVRDHWVVCIGGEHEDFYDPDFMIYNDVIVWDLHGRIDIFGYPKGVFPPTDFHTATLLGEEIVIIGGLGYQEDREFWRTPVYVLDLEHFYITPLEVTGDCPGWIFEHRATLVESDDPARATVIRVEGGKRLNENSNIFTNKDVFELNLTANCWTRVS